MFGKKKRKDLFKHKKYKLNRRDNFRNPFRLQKALFNFKIFKIINIILVVVILVCGYFFLFSNNYNITNIEVTGNKIIAIEDVLDIVHNYLGQRKMAIFSNKNIFLCSKKQLVSEINKVIVLDSISVEKILPNTIKINLKEKNVVLNFITNGQEYLVDNQGLVIKRVYKFRTPEIFRLTDEQPTTANLPTDLIFIQNLANEDVNLGNQILNSEDVLFITDLIAQAKTKDYLQVAAIKIPNILPQFIIYQLKSGPEVYFNLNDAVAKQLERLNILITDKIKVGNLRNFQYIDLKLGESIYYK